MIDYGSAFLKVPREVVEAIGRDANALAVYLTILARVRWDSPTRVSTGRGSIDLDIGQCVLGREEIAKAVGISIRSARTALQTLVDLEIIDQQATNRGTTVTLLGFKGTLDAHNGERPAEPTPKKRPANGQQNTQQNGQQNGQQKNGATPHGHSENRGEQAAKRPAERPAECPAGRPGNDHYQDQDQSPDLSFFLADPEPRHGGRADLVQGKAELYDPSAPIDSAAALAALQTLMHGGPRKGAIAVDREGPPTLQILQGGTP